MSSLALVLVLVAAPDREYDVLEFKDGRTLTGFIVSETKEKVRFRVVIVGDKGETSGGMTAVFRKAGLAGIERASKEARDRAKARSDAAGTHAVDYELALRKLFPTEVRFLGRDALRLRGEHFVVVSTCEDRFVREVAFYLDEVYRAYRKTFGITEKADREVTVYMLQDVNEYRRFQQARFGGAIRNPAFFYPKGRSRGRSATTSSRTCRRSASSRTPARPRRAPTRVKGFEELMGAPMRRVEAELGRHLASLGEK